LEGAMTQVVKKRPVFGTERSAWGRCAKQHCEQAERSGRKGQPVTALSLAKICVENNH